jgi:guanylate kinase
MFVVLTGPSGVGKTAVADKLMEMGAANRFVTCTDRCPRDEEENGVHYHFMSRDEFSMAKDAGEFLETFEYAGHNHGSRYKDLERLRLEGKHIVFVMEINGAQKIKAAFPDNTRIVYLKRNIRDLILSVLERKISNEDKADRIIQMEDDLKVCNMDCIDYHIKNETGRLHETVAAVAALL